MVDVLRADNMKTIIAEQIEPPTSINANLKYYANKCS
jgi:hypothetical protein